MRAISGKCLRRCMCVACAALVVSAVLSWSAAPAGEAAPSAARARARNVILIINDGWGYNQSAATGMYKNGRVGGLNYEKFPVHFAMSTYRAGGSYDPRKAWADFDYVRDPTTDSAAAATALATGRKTYNGAIGVVGSKDDPRRVETVIEAAEKLGKATGVVTSVEFSHATPAAFVAHNVSRNNYEEIAREMLFESAVEVIMGAGHPLYAGMSATPMPADEVNYKFVGGEEAWVALIARDAGADCDGDGKGDPWILIEGREDFQKLASGPTPKRVCGIARVETTLQQKRFGDKHAAPFEVPFNKGVPTLAEMTAAALNVLDNDPDGFFLMIEGGAVDWAGHAAQSGRMIEEALGTLDALDVVIEWVGKNSSWQETLVVITGDHETGYLTGPGSGPSRFELEKAGDLPPEGEKLASPNWVALKSNGPDKLPDMEWHDGGHTNSLIPLYAKGAGSHLFEKYADEIDPVRGRYLDNAEVGKVLFEVMR